MNKLIAFYMFCFVCSTVLSTFGEGAGGFCSTQLDGALDETATTITVDNTTGFLDGDYIVIENEYIQYTWKDDTHFGRVADPCIRGYDNTEADAYEDNRQVYSPDSGIVNKALGFNVATTGGTAGDVSIPSIVLGFFTRVMPKLITWNFPFLEGDLFILRLILMGIGTGFVVYMGIAVINAIMGIFKR